MSSVYKKKRTPNLLGLHKETHQDKARVDLHKETPQDKARVDLHKKHHDKARVDLNKKDAESHQNKKGVNKTEAKKHQDVRPSAVVRDLDKPGPLLKLQPLSEPGLNVDKHPLVKTVTYPKDPGRWADKGVHTSDDFFRRPNLEKQRIFGQILKDATRQMDAQKLADVLNEAKLEEQRMFGRVLKDMIFQKR